MEYGLWHTLTQAAVLNRLWFTVWQSSLTVVIALAVGGSLAILERWLHQTTPRWFVGLCSLIVFLPPIIVTTSFIITYGQAGILNAGLTQLGLTPIHLLYTKAAVLLAHSYYNIPLAFIVLRTALAAVPTKLEDSSAIIGASRWQKWTLVYWPYLRLPLLGVSALIFLYCFTSFIVPLQLGGHQAQTLEVWLYQEIYLYHRYVSAAWIAGTQFFILAGGVALLLWAQPKILSLNQPHATNSTSSTSANFAIKICRLGLASFLTLPITMLLLHSVQQFFADQLNILAQTQFFAGLGRSLVIAACALTITIVSVWSVRLSGTIGLALVALSPITLAFVWLFTFGKGYISLIGAFIIALVPVVSIIFQTVKARQPRFLTTTARLLGASLWQQRLLEWQLTKPALRRCLAIGSIIVIGDATISSMLAKTDQPLAMPVVLQLISSYRFGLGSLALLLLLLLFFLIINLVYAHDHTA
ncbi:MAG: thiamine transporter membrane protein [uncultured bacterium]|nr:MAG: thiamine transporter membrane protein [uncultured bacterium]